MPIRADRKERPGGRPCAVSMTSAELEIDEAALVAEVRRTLRRVEERDVPSADWMDMAGQRVAGGCVRGLEDASWTLAHYCGGPVLKIDHPRRAGSALVIFHNTYGVWQATLYHPKGQPKLIEA